MSYYVTKYCYTCKETRRFYINTYGSETLEVCGACGRSFRSNTSPSNYQQSSTREKVKIPDDFYQDVDALIEEFLLKKKDNTRS